MGKVGSACASRFFLMFLPAFPWLPSLRKSATSTLAAFDPFSSVAGRSVPIAKLQADSVSRVAPSGILRVAPVDNGDIVDKAYPAGLAPPSGAAAGVADGAPPGARPP